MKTVFSFCGKWSCRIGFLSLLLLFFGLSANAQRGGYKGVTNRNGMLVFTDSLAFQSVYQQLEAEIEAQDRNPNAKPGPMLPGNCEDDNAVLANFESLMGIQSMRRKYLVKECQDLARGLSPEQLSENPIPDDILAAFLNEKGEMQVGNRIYLLPTVKNYFIINDGDMRTLAALHRGVNPGNFSNVEVHDNIDLSLDFQVEYLAANTVQFTYTGDRVVGMSFLWNFGDGTTSTEINPVHTFPEGIEQDYKVTLTVTMPNQSSSTQTKDLGEVLQIILQIYRTIRTLADCYPWFWFPQETGVPGEVCFTSNIVGDYEVESYLWEFGDGTTSTEANPCHIYTCDKLFYVRLTTTTKKGCTHTFPPAPIPGFPVNIDSYNCCASFAGESGYRHYYDGGERRIKYVQSHFYIFAVGTFASASMTNYRKKNNGGWKKHKANLKVALSGNVYTKSSEGCACETPYNISSYKIRFNKKRATISKFIPGKAKVSASDPWKGLYTVNGSLIHTQEMPVTCD